ncbi:MAG: NAD(+)/NADH kinase [Spirochaetes bacterium]|nr:NAD(+)/NADH kinase [Spirochaetota bacterium]
MKIQYISINIRHDDESTLPLLDELIEYLRKKRVCIQLPDYQMIGDSRFAEYIVDNDNFINRTDCIVAIGGDGTFLRTARLFVDTGKPIFGINRGRMGFLTEFGPDEYLQYLEDIFSGRYRTAERPLLSATHRRKGKDTGTLCFLNDAVISKGAFSRAIRIELEIDGESLNAYSGDGLIVATSTGSTAYSLSAGGPIVVPATKDVFILNPVCPHTLAMRSMILPSTSIVKARILSEFKNLLLTIDGQEAIRIDGEDEVLFHQSDKKILLITHPRKNFYAILQEKLGWGESHALRTEN